MTSKLDMHAWCLSFFSNRVQSSSKRGHEFNQHESDTNAKTKPKHHSQNHVESASLVPAYIDGQVQRDALKIGDF